MRKCCHSHRKEEGMRILSCCVLALILIGTLHLTMQSVQSFSHLRSAAKDVSEIFPSSTVPPTASPVPTRTDETKQKQLIQSYGKLPLSFEANQGQTDPQVKFITHGAGYGLFLTNTEAVFALKNSYAKEKISPSKSRQPARP